MKKNMQTPFSTRQYMLSREFELYYYSDSQLTSVAGHTHDYYEFYFFLEGSVSMQIDTKQYALTHGDIILIPPNLPHNLVIHNPVVPYRRFVFWISQEFCSRLLAVSKDYGYLMQFVQTKKQYIFYNDRITFNSIQSKLLRLLEEMQGNRFCREPQISLYVNDLILHMNRIVYEKMHPPQQSETDLLYQNICSFIEEHIEENLSLERISNEFFLSKYHIAHLFKEHMGLSIHQYITKKRLSLCRQAIEGDMTIKEAYQTFGFGDYTSFFRAFKKEYGISPKDFRDMRYINAEN